MVMRTKYAVEIIAEFIIFGYIVGPDYYLVWPPAITTAVRQTTAVFPRLCVYAKVTLVRFVMIMWFRIC